MCSGKRSSEFRINNWRPPRGTVTFTHPDWFCSTLQNGTRRWGPASSIGKLRNEVPPPEKNNWLVGTKLPAKGEASQMRTLLAKTIERTGLYNAYWANNLAKFALDPNAVGVIPRLMVEYIP